jgi:hypothetical protein
MTIKRTSSSIGMYVGEFRVLRFNEADSWAQFLRHYEVPFNAKWNNTLNYIFIRDGVFNMQPSSASSYQV